MALNYLKSFGKQCIRVWHLLRKPEKEEFWIVAKVSAIGLLVVGAVGFLVALLMGFISI
jgi:protein transport protein SEC61 subunit gamma-like protein